ATAWRARPKPPWAPQRTTRVRTGPALRRGFVEEVKTAQTMSAHSISSWPPDSLRAWRAPQSEAIKKESRRERKGEFAHRAQDNCPRPRQAEGPPGHRPARIILAA